MQSASYEFVIVFVRYRLLLAIFFFFFSVKPFSFIKQIINKYCANVSLFKISATISKKSAFIRWSNLDFCVSIDHHYGCNIFFRETISLIYWLPIPSVYRIKCLGQILYFFILWFHGLFGYAVLCIDFSENRSDFSKNFLNFSFDEIEKQSINLSRF